MEMRVFGIVNPWNINKYVSRLVRGKSEFEILFFDTILLLKFHRIQILKYNYKK